MIEYIKKNKKTFYMKIVLILMFIPIVTICVFAAPQLLYEGLFNSDVEFWYVLPFGVLMSLTLFPVSFAIFHTWKLFSNIEKKTFFSKDSSNRLRFIMFSGYITTILFIGMLPSIFYFTEMDDAPGLAMLGLVFVGASTAIVVFASVMRDIVIEQVE